MRTSPPSSSLHRRQHADLESGVVRPRSASSRMSADPAVGTAISATVAANRSAVSANAVRSPTTRTPAERQSELLGVVVEQRDGHVRAVGVVEHRLQHAVAAVAGTEHEHAVARRRTPGGGGGSPGDATPSERRP